MESDHCYSLQYTGHHEKIRAICCAFCDMLVLVPLGGGNGGRFIAVGDAKDHHATACGRKKALSTDEEETYNEQSD